MVQLAESTESLEAQALYGALAELLQEANDLLHREPVSQVHQHLRQAGFKKLPQLYKSAHRDLQVLRTVGKLHIPVKAEAGAGPVDPPPYAGSTAHMGGVCDRALVAANSPQLGTKQGWHADLIPEVEARLEAKCRWLAGVLEHLGEPAGVGEAAAAAAAASAALQQQNTASALGLAEDLACHLRLLAAFLEQQAAFVQAHKLAGRRAEDAAEVAALQEGARAQMLKVQVIERRLLACTYTQQALPALQAVAGHLAGAEAEAESTLQQLRAQLGRFEELGPEFASLAARYRGVAEELRHAEFSLAELRAAAAAEAGAEAASP